MHNFRIDCKMVEIEDFEKFLGSSHEEFTGIAQFFFPFQQSDLIEYNIDQVVGHMPHN